MGIELTSEQIERQDHVDNAIHALLEELAGEALSWDISLIGEVRDVISSEFVKRNIMKEGDFYPFVSEDSEGVTSMNHEHEWVVYSTAMKECWLMLQCVECGAMATVDDPNKEEWSRAFHAPSRPYRWIDDARVRVRHEPPCPLYVIGTEKGATTCSCSPKAPGNDEREYERFPAEIVKPGDPLTEEDVAELEELAELVGRTDVCSRLFPLMIRSFQDETGHEPAGAVKRIAARIEEIDRMGLHCAPQVVARVLREYIKVIPASP